jgi:hypothetical protein
MRKNLLLIGVLVCLSKDKVISQSWSALASGIGPYNGNVNSTALFNGRLYAAGTFTTAGGASANNIATWDGLNWSPVSTGLNGGVYSLAVYNGDLYAGGWISGAGGVGVNNIARWNGSSWSPVGSGVDGTVESMIVYNGELYVGGGFYTAGTTTANSIAKWNGTTWSAVGNGIESFIHYVQCFAVYNGELYAAGPYYWDGGVADHFSIIKWNGSNWSDFATIPASYTLDGALGDILCMKVYNGELYIAGAFFGVDSITTSQIAKWNGTYWSAVGSGINFESFPFGGDSDGSAYSFVKSLEVFQGALYATGRFFHCDTISTAGIAKWDGNNWSNLGQGLNGRGYTLTASDTCLFVGGWFPYANGFNGVSANNIAKWKEYCPGTLSQPGIISGSDTVCENTIHTYSVNPVEGALSYTWNLPTGWSGSSTTNSITITVGSDTGVITVRANNNCGSSGLQNLIVTVNHLPLQPGLINGNDSVCEGTTEIYSISPVIGAVNYTWNYPPGWSGYSNTNSVTITAGVNSGNLSVIANNYCGVSTPQTIMITSNSIPVMPAFIDGNDAVCEGSSQTYFINAVPGASGYAWDLTFGTAFGLDSTTITITALHSGYPDDFITVSAYNNCGNSDMLTFPVKINPLPQQPGSITGDLSVCKGSTQKFSINPLPDATSYTWTLPSGWTGTSTSTSINVTAGNDAGDISVKANNSCGSGPLATIFVLQNTIPAKPGEIKGNSYVIKGEKNIYSIDTITHASGYNWSLDGGGKITVGQSPNKIEIDWQTAGDYVLSVNAINNCGVSTDQKMNISVSGANEKNPYGLQLYPNPSGGQFFLKAKRIQDKLIGVQVLNMAGQSVFRSGKRQGANDYSQLITLDKMATGLYAVKIMIDDKTYVRSIMIK